MKKIKYKNELNKGITLVALVITIIVLLILAGITINLVFGENGIINKASVVGEEAKRTSAKEELIIMVGDYKIEKYENDQLTFEGYFQDKVDNIEDNTDGTYTVEYKGYEFLMDDVNGTVEYIGQVEGIRATAESKIYQTDGQEIIDGTDYKELAVTIKITNKAQLGTIDSIIMEKSNGDEITKETNPIGDTTAEASYIVSESGMYTVKIQATTEGITKITNIKIQVKIPTILKVGDYVNYIPDIASDYTVPLEYSGYISDQTIKQDTTLKWRVLRIYDNGSIDLISEFPTDQTMYLGGAKGYNNGVYLINDVCEALYSKGTIKARSIKIEDIEDQMTESGEKERNSYSHYDTRKTFMEDSKYYYLPYLYYNEKYAQTYGSYNGENGFGKSDKATLYTSTSEYGMTKILGMKSTFYSIKFSKLCNNEAALLFTSNNYYWVASRYTQHTDVYKNITFGINIAGTNFSGRKMCIGDYKSISTADNYLRPIVSIGADMQLKLCTGANSINNMHTIQYK